MTGDDISWVYPDLQTVLTGKFLNGQMIEGRASRVVAQRYTFRGRSSDSRELKVAHQIFHLTTKMAEILFSSTYFHIYFKAQLIGS